MFSAKPAGASSRRRSRLVAACTTGVLSIGAFAMAPAMAHADAPTPASHRAVTPEHAVPRPTLDLPVGKNKKNKLAGTASAAQLSTPRYDVDGDGGADFLTQEDDNSIQQRLSGTGDWSEIGTSSVRYLNILTPGDLDASQAGPEVLALSTTGKLSLFTNGNFPSDYPLWVGSGWGVYNKLVATGDISGDGKADLLARAYNGDLYLYKGTGNGSAPFSARVKVGTGYGIYDQIIGAGDITSTGRESVVARDLDGNLWLYQGTGSSTAPLAARVKVGTGWGIYNQIIGVGDDDGAVGTILGRTVAGDLYYYEGTGTGALTSRQFIGSYWNDALIAGQGTNLLWGKNNLFARTAGGSLYYYFGMTNGLISASSKIDGDWSDTHLIAPVALTQSGDEPLLDASDGYLWNDLTGNEISGGWGGYNLTLGPGDLSGDGNSDLLARDGSGVLWNFTGRGGDALYGRVKIGAGWNGYNAVVGAGDIDGDGRADIVARASNGHLYLYRGTGVGATPFLARVDIGAGWGAYTKLAAPGDLDGDGRADIVAVTSSGELYRYGGSGRTGTSTFKARVRIGTSGWNSYSSIA